MAEQITTRQVLEGRWDEDKNGKRWEDYETILCPDGTVIDMVNLLEEQHRAMAALTHLAPMFGGFISKLRFIYTFRVKTQATDGFNVFVNPQFTNNLDFTGKCFVMAHELMHCLLNHMRRGKGHDHERSNIAADYEVNVTLADIGLFKEATMKKLKAYILMSVLDSIPNGKEYSCVVKTLSNETPDNFTLPKYVEIDGQEKATDVPKTWLPVYKPTGDRDKDQMLDDACGKGLLFIDELSRATPQVLNVILPIINEGIFNGYKLGSGWVIIVASNRAEDEMSGQADIGNALGNRFRQVYYEPTAKSWSEWAKTQGYMSPLLLQWLSMPEHENMSGGKYFYMDPNETMEGAGVTKIMCTPRSWTNAMRELALYSETGKLEGFTIFDIPRDILAMTLNQYVPAQAVDSFLAFLEVISKIGNFDQAVRDIWKNGGKNFSLSKKDLHMVALPLAQLVVTAHSQSYPTKEEFENLCTWLVAQKSDQLASYILDILQNVFAGVFNNKAEKMRGGIFVMAKKIKVLDKQDKNKANMYRDAYKPLTDKWGFTLDTMPDWSTGHQMLVKAFGQAFADAIVDGVEGLG